MASFAQALTSGMGILCSEPVLLISANLSRHMELSQVDAWILL